MRWLIPIILFCSLPSYASIARSGSCSASATSCTLSAAATGNLNLFWAYHAASATVPTVPSGYQKIGSYPASPTATTGAAVLYCKIATSSSDTGSGTATNATAVAGLSYSGTNAPSNLNSSCAGMGAGQGVFNNATASTTITLSALTGGNAILNSNDWIAAFEGDSTSGDTCTPSTVWTSVSNTGDVRALDSNGTVSSYASSLTCTVASTNHIGVVVAISAPPQTGSSGPQFKRGYFHAGCGSGFLNCTTAAPIVDLDVSGSPRTASAGDMVLVIFTYPTATTLTINDSTSGSNTWTLDASQSDTFGNTHGIYRSILSATTTSITPTMGTAEGNWQFSIVVLYNTASSSPVDGTPICTANVTPTTNLGNTVTAGSVTTTAANDMVMQFAWADNNGGLGLANQAFAFGFGDDQIGLANDWSSGSSGGSGAGGYGSQYFIQGTAGSIETGMNFVQTTHDTFTSCEIAYKSGSSGVVPNGNIAIVRSQTVFWNTSRPSPVYQQFPSIPGNMIVLANDSGDAGWSIFGGTPGTTYPTDSSGGTLNAIADTVSPTIDPQLAFSCNLTLSTNETFSITPGTATGSDILTFFEFTNAVAGSSTSCLDTGATVGTGTQTPAVGTGSNSLSATSSGACLSITSNTPSGGGFTGYPICVPTTNDLFIDVGVMGTGPVTGNTTMQFDYTWGSGVGDNSSATNGNGVAHTYSSSQVSANWTATGTTGINAIMASFKEAPPSSGCIPELAAIGAGCQ